MVDETLSDNRSYRATVARLSAAQKPGRGAPPYSRWVNRRLGRWLAAAAYLLGRTPDQVTTVSALTTLSGLVLVGLGEPTWWLGVLVAALLLLGYAFDAADGQLARLRGGGSMSGEWLDHVVDATKVVVLPLAVGVGWFVHDAVPQAWLVVPLVAAVAGSVLFFAMILTEQLRRAHGVVSEAATGGRAPWLRSVLVLPTDYGVLCVSFLLLGAPLVFATVYAALTAATAAFLLLALVKWRRELKVLGARRVRAYG